MATITRFVTGSKDANQAVIRVDEYFKCLVSAESPSNSEQKILDKKKPCKNRAFFNLVLPRGY
jgi:hypothetical protein